MFILINLSKTAICNKYAKNKLSKKVELKDFYTVRLVKIVFGVTTVKMKYFILNEIIIHLLTEL
jgi:hypothetical protein